MTEIPKLFIMNVVAFFLLVLLLVASFFTKKQVDILQSQVYEMKGGVSMAKDVSGSQEEMLKYFTKLEHDSYSDEVKVNQWTEGGWYDWSGVQNEGEASVYSYASLNIADTFYGANEFYISGVANNNAVLYCFLDQNGVLINSYPSEAVNGLVYYNTMSVQIPKNADTLILNKIGTAEIHIFRKKTVTSSLELDAGKIYNTKLQGKTVYGFGDSLMHGTFGNQGIAQSLAEKYQWNYKNMAVGGATVKDSGNSILSQIEKAPANVPDFILVDGGTNDMVPETVIGEITGDSQYSQPLDTSTFCGGLENIFSNLREKYPGSTIIYIAAHKMPTRDAVIQAAIQNVAKQICEKWAIPVADIYREGEINTHLRYYASTYSARSDQEQTNGDGTHLNADGYRKFYAPIIESIMVNYSF